LIVVTAKWKLHQFDSQIVKPFRAPWQPHLPVLDSIRLTDHPRNFVAFRLKSDGLGRTAAITAQVLNERRARSFIFDEHSIWAEFICVVDNAPS